MQVPHWRYSKIHGQSHYSFFLHRKPDVPRFWTGEWGFTVSECSREDADVRAFSIPGIMKKYGFPYIDILKMDIEGSEYEIFKDKKCLEWLPLVKVLIIETHDRKIPGCETH